MFQDLILSNYLQHFYLKIRWVCLKRSVWISSYLFSVDNERVSVSQRSVGATLDSLRPFCFQNKLSSSPALNFPLFGSEHCFVLGWSGRQCYGKHELGARRFAVYRPHILHTGSATVAPVSASPPVIAAASHCWWLLSDAWNVSEHIGKACLSDRLSLPTFTFWLLTQLVVSWWIPN